MSPASQRSGSSPADHVASGFFLLRTPLLPFEALLDWTRDLEAAQPESQRDGPLDETLARDRATLRERLRHVLRDPAVEEAIYLASPDLHAEIGRWSEDPDSNDGRNAERSLVRYFVRMAGRATPFGLFAGCTVGTIGDRTALVLEDRRRWRRHTQLDSEYLLSAARALLDRGAGRLFANSSLHLVADRWHYVQPRDDGGYRSYHLVAAEDSPPLRRILEAARGGTTLAALADLLVQEQEVGAEEAHDFLHELITRGLLVTELPAITGSAPRRQLVELAGTAAEPARGALLEAVSRLDSLDREALGVDPACYAELSQSLGALDVQAAPKSLLQVDLVTAAREATISPAVTEEMLRTADALRRITPARDPLRAFRLAFLDRYQGRAVPLNQLLDPQSGIGFPDNAPSQGASEPGASPSTFVLERAAEMWMAGEAQWTLSKQDLERLSVQEAPPLPDAFHVHATIAARSGGDVDRGRFSLLWHGAAGPSGANLFGRFCHALPELVERVRSHLRAEEELRPNVLFAEVVHLPEDRVANILSRPLLRGYEIPFLGFSGAAEECRIPVDDLHVFDSGSRLVLWSAARDTEIVPRLTTAHNFLSKRGVPVYRFLCALQAHSCQYWMGWEWDLAEALPALPRVQLGRTLLAPARWRVPEGIGDFGAVQRWRKRFRVPRHVAVVEGDRRLPVDLEATLSVDTLLHRLKKGAEIRVAEILPGPEELCVTGEDGRYVHELVVPFRLGAPPSRMTPPRPVLDLDPHERRVPLGSEWSYLKLYCGVGIADHLLRTWLRPLLGRLARRPGFDRWFFIRYADPAPHLRIRIRASSVEVASELRETIELEAAPLLASGVVQRMQYETYEREVERYGGREGIAVAERLFRHDSEAVLALLELPGAGDSARRELFGLRGVAGHLDDLGLPPADRVELLEQLSAPGKAQAREWDRLFRERRSAIEAAAGSSHATGDADQATAIYRLRSDRSRAAMTEYRRLQDAGRLTVPLGQITASLMHMHINRLLREDQPAVEGKLYYWLHKAYRSLIARERAAAAPRPRGAETTKRG